MIVVERVHRVDTLPATARGYGRDTLTLGWEDRRYVRARRRSDGGLTFGLSVPRGTVLRGGDCLIVDEAKTVVVVVERAEPVFLIEPRTPHEWGLYAYHIGNRHQPLMITETGIVCPDIAAVEALLRQQRIPYSRTTLSFKPAAPIAADHD